MYVWSKRNIHVGVCIVDVIIYSRGKVRYLSSCKGSHCPFNVQGDKNLCNTPVRFNNTEMMGFVGSFFTSLFRDHVMVKVVRRK